MEVAQLTPEINNHLGNKSKSFKFKYFIDKEESSEISIFGDIFVQNNKDKCHLIINGNDCELRAKYKFKEKGEQTITLIIDQEIINYSKMFIHEKSFMDKMFSNDVNNYYKNNNLIDVSSLENLDTSNCIDLSYMFCGCYKIKNFNFLLNWNVSNCKYFNCMFKDCSFSDVNFLSKWNIINAIKLSSMFRNCRNLKDIEGIKNWNVKNVVYFRRMFSHCINITDVNALQNWNMNNAKDISFMFFYCENLVNMDSLYKWNLSEKVDKTNIVNGCGKLCNVPSNIKSSSCSIY